MLEENRENVKSLMPDINNESKSFWDGLSSKELIIQHCKKCKQTQFPPSTICNNCLNENITKKKCSGKGRLWSIVGFWKNYLEPYNDTPYYVALVELEEGPLIIGRITKDTKEKVTFDSPLLATFYETKDKTVILGFK